MIDIKCMLVINLLDSAVTNTYMCHFIIVTLNKNLYVVIQKRFFIRCILIIISYIKNTDEMYPGRKFK